MSLFFLNHPRETDLALFAGGELGPIARWRIERHLDKCGRCQTEVADFFHLQSDLSDLAELPAVDFQALAHRIKVAAAQDQPETEPVSVAGWFRQPAAWRLGVVSAAALCAFVVYKQLPLVKTVPENPVFFDQVAVEGLLQAEGDQLGQTEALAPAEEVARQTFAFHRLEESAQKADVAQDLDDAEHARQLPSESARQKAKQVTAPASQSVAAPAGRADGPASAAVAKVNRPTVNRTIGGSAEGLSSGISDELEENLRTNTELANAGLENAELGVNEKLRAIASDTKVAVVSGEAQFKKESSGSLQDGRTGGYREQPELNAQLQDAQLQAGQLQDDQSRDSASQQPQPAQAPASVLDELKEADLSASAIQGRGRAAVNERDYFGGDRVDKNAPADPDNQPEPVAGARKPVRLAVNKGPAESRIIAQEAGAGKRVAELEKSGFAADGPASGDRTSNAETFADTQFSVLPAAWNDSNTEVGVAADGGMMIRALDSATGTITITNVYLP